MRGSRACSIRISSSGCIASGCRRRSSGAIATGSCPPATPRISRSSSRTRGSTSSLDAGTPRTSKSRRSSRGSCANSLRRTEEKASMNVLLFHLMPYADLDLEEADRYPHSWVTLPNRLYDPRKGHALYNRYLDELEYAEELGFDGVCVNEHHQNAYGLMPSPNLFAATLARRTSKIKIAVVGNALPLYNRPTRVAEEYAIIDCISGGRLIAGMVVGGGPEYYSFSINPTQARERFREALDLVIAAWTRDGPFEWNGTHFKIRYVNPWPKPIQPPHPPIWIPGVGSVETMELVAERGYSYMGIPYFHIDVFLRNYDLFRETASKMGKDVDPMQLGRIVPIYVADTDSEARREYEQHLWYFAHKLLK